MLVSLSNHIFFLTNKKLLKNIKMKKIAHNNLFDLNFLLISGLNFFIIFMLRGIKGFTFKTFYLNIVLVYMSFYFS